MSNTEISLDFNSYLTDLENCEDKWITNVVYQYALAYIDAKESFDSVLANKAASDAKKIELALAALSLVGGGLLTRVFAEATLKNAASNIALDVICKNNMEKAFNAAHFISANKVANFAVGTLWDKAQSELETSIKAKIVKLSNSNSNYASFAQDPLKVKTLLEQYVKDIKVVIHDTGAFIRDSDKMSENSKRTLLSYLKQAPFYFQAPNNKLDKDKLKLDIELTFFMYIVLDQDYLEITDYVGAPYYGKSETKTQSIAQMPSAKNYPTDKFNKTSSISGFSASVVGHNEVVKFSSIASAFITHIDLLYRKRNNKDFFLPSEKNGIVNNGKITKNTLIRAENCLNELAASNISVIVKDILAPVK